MTEAKNAAVDSAERVLAALPPEWRAHGPDLQFEKLKKSHSSSVFRVRRPEGRPATIIGKIAARDSIHHEAGLYRDILPAADVWVAEIYDVVDEPGERWSLLVMEDIPDQAYDRNLPEDRLAVLRALARLHKATAKDEVRLKVPDRGVADHRAHFEEGWRCLRLAEANLEFAPEELAILTDSLRMLDQYERHWPVLEAAIVAAPKALLHADAAPKNMRLRREAGSMRAIFLDWEMAGWGSIGIDLDYWGRNLFAARSPESVQMMRAELAEYLAELDGCWPTLNLGDVERVAGFGSLQRGLAAIHWAAKSLVRPWHQAAIHDLRAYRNRLGVLLDSLLGPAGRVARKRTIAPAPAIVVTLPVPARPAIAEPPATTVEPAIIERQAKVKTVNAKFGV